MATQGINGQPSVFVGATRIFLRLALFDSVVRTNRSAATTADASVLVDVVDITLRDSLNRANRKTCTARDASVSTYVSHSFKY